jgi:dTDP-4-dehydrorhamnose 3,5-epimerase
MNVIETELPGVLIIEPTVHRDVRGFFMETYHADRYRAAGIATVFKQTNQSRSMRGTLRGLHWQEGAHPQAKLVRTIVGNIFEVAADIRPDSATFGQWVGIYMRGDRFRQLFIPAGFAHGFCVLSEVAEVEYKCSDIYDPSGERGVMWNDSDLNIEWPIIDPLVSDRDLCLPSLRAVRDAREAVTA